MKILKLFISLSLILSVSLINSIAAISVSDGSAFVTKAEFAADLNNLSNRMSSLENSLDAKIDSLVSSYLSRNGIWNGEKQTKKIDGISLGVSIKFSDSNNDRVCVLKKNQNIMEISKSGLVCLDMYLPGRMYTSIVLKATEGSHSIGTGSLVLYIIDDVLSIDEASWETASALFTTSFINSTKTSYTLSSLDEKYTRNNGGGYLVSLTIPAFKTSLYFFSSKGDSLYANIVFVGMTQGQPLSDKTLTFRGNTQISFDAAVY